MSGLYCQNCRWWNAGGSKMSRVRENPVKVDGLGTCHLMPPVPLAIGPGWADAVFPETWEDNVCAEWEEPDADDPERERAPERVDTVVQFPKVAA